MSEERRQKLEERLAWLERSMVSMQANYRRSPKFAAMLLAVIPAWIVAGSLVAFLVALMVVAFVSVLIYVAWSHQNENEAELRSVRAELRRMRVAREAAEAPKAS